MKFLGGTKTYRGQLFLLGLVIGIFMTFIHTSLVYAQTPGLQKLLSDKCRIDGDCDIKEFYTLLFNTANFFLQIVGALMLVMFVYGGYLLIISGGSSNLIGKAKNIFVGSIIGLILVFGAYAIINVVIVSITEGQLNDVNRIQGFENIENLNEQGGVVVGCCQNSLFGDCLMSYKAECGVAGDQFFPNGVCNQGSGRCE